MTDHQRQGRSEDEERWYSEFVEVAKAFRHVPWGQFLVGAYTGMHFPFLLLFSHAMRVLTWPWAFAVGMVTGRPAHRVQPNLRFACIVRSMAAFADSSALAPLLAGADSRERSALHLMPLLVGAEYGFATFANVLLLRAPFRLEPSGSKRFTVVVGEGEPLTRMDRAFLLGFISVLPVAILVSAVLTETGLVS